MIAIYSKCTFILLNRKSIIILNHVNSQNKTLLQLTLDLLFYRNLKSRILRTSFPVKTSHYIAVKPHCYFSRCFGWNQKPGISTALPGHHGTLAPPSPALGGTWLQMTGALPANVDFQLDNTQVKISDKCIGDSSPVYIGFKVFIYAPLWY